MKKARILLLAATAVTLAACSNDEATTANGGGEALPEGMYPLEIGAVTIGVEGGEAQPWGAKTRVAETSATECAWSDGDQISVRIGDDGDVKTYTYNSADGKFESTDPCYWQSTKPATVTAWYTSPTYTSTTDGTTTVSLKDQSSGLAYVLKATAENVAFNNAATLTFEHQLTKVKVKIGGKSIPTPSEVSISGYPTCTVSSNGTVTASGTKDYIPMRKATYSDGTTSTTYYEACLVPGTLDKSNAIKIVSGGYTLTASLGSDVKLTASNMHTLEISSEVEIIDISELSSIYTISDGGTYYFTGSKTSNFKGIQVTGSDNPTIVLNGATLSRGGSCIWGTSYTLQLQGTNSVASTTDAAAITVSKDNTLTINGSGSLTAKCIKDTYYGGAGIGGGNNSACGNIKIEGGTVIAKGGAHGGAGIGGGNNSACGDIAISGGTVTATGGYNGGAGIGGGNNRSTCGNITISGGTVRATGGDGGGAGIGGGYNASGCSGDITISGGTVTATGGNEGGAGIGGGYDRSTCGNITISGGTVTATGGYNGGDTVGNGSDNSDCGSITRNGGAVINGTTYN